MEEFSERFDEKSEQELIATIISNGNKFSNFRWLKSDDFFFEPHKMIWKCMKRLFKDGKEINYFSVYDMLRSMKIVIDCKYLDALMLSGASLASLSYLAKRIKRKSIERKILEGEELTQEIVSDLNKETTETIIVKASDVVGDELKDITAGKHLESIGYKSGYPILDSTLGGFKKGDLVIIAGRPAMGKTTCALNFALRFSSFGYKCLYINLEMSARQLARKIISYKTDINSKAFNRELDLNEMTKAMSLGNNIKHENLEILDLGKITLDEIRHAIKTSACDILIIDQLTKIKHLSKRERLDQEIAEITFELKSMAKEFSIPIILLHQINREAEKREHKVPLLSDLRDSGAVEQDGDVILFIHRDNYYTGDESDKEAIIRIAKNKMGETGQIRFLFYPEFSRFTEK